MPRFAGVPEVDPQEPFRAEDATHRAEHVHEMPDERVGRGFLSDLTCPSVPPGDRRRAVVAKTPVGGEVMAACTEAAGNVRSTSMQ